MVVLSLHFYNNHLEMFQNVRLGCAQQCLLFLGNLGLSELIKYVLLGKQKFSIQPGQSKITRLSWL